jgi:hypothetical protein
MSGSARSVAVVGSATRLADRIGAKLEEFLLLPKTHRMPNLLIVGETNNGKTAMLSRFVRQHPPQEGNGDIASGIPVIAMEAPPVPDERRFYAEILRQVFAPFRPSKSAGQLQYEVLRLLATVEVKLLIIDEIQHVLAGPLLKQRQFRNVIKNLGNELQIPIVAAGTQDAFNAIQTDPQLANRFEPCSITSLDDGRGLPATVGQFRGRSPARAPLWARRAGLGAQDHE